MTHCNLRIRFFFVVFFFWALSVNAETAISSGQKQITVVFRYDDYSAFSATDLEIKLFKVFQNHGLRCTCGVIPYVCVGNCNDPSPQDVAPLNRTKAAILRESIKTGTLEIALHGYSHHTISGKTSWDRSEFSGLDYENQLKQIGQGKKYLEELLHIRINTFIPPWNTHDFNTIRALENLSFRCLSAGETGETRKSSGLKYLPATCELSQLRAAVRVARRIPDLRPIIVVYFHGYDFFEVSQDKNKPSYQDFSKILDWLTSQKDIQVLSIDQTISLIDDLSARRFINYNSYLNLRLSDSINLPFLRKLCLSGVYFSPRTVADLRVKILIYLCLCYLFLGGAAAVIAFQVGSTVLSRLKSKLSIYINGGGVLVILIIFVTLRDLKVNYREALIFVSSFGAYVGLWWALRRSASRREKY